MFKNKPSPPSHGAIGPDAETLRGTIPLPGGPSGCEQAFAHEPRVALLVYHRDGAEVRLLDSGAPVTVGRCPPSDVRIADITLSREHARFTLSGARVVVEDLGSTNGTRHGGELIQRAEIKPGDEVALGSVVAGVHALGATEGLVGGGIEGDERFREHLEEEALRARHFRRRFALLMVRAIAGGGADSAAEGEARPAPRRPTDEHGHHPEATRTHTTEAHVSRWSMHVRVALRPVDRVALYSPDSLQILMPEVEPDAVLEAARRITMLQPGQGLTLLVGVALYPESAGTAETLIETSREALKHTSAAQPVKIGPVTGNSVATPAAPPLVVGAKMREIHAMATRIAASRIPVILIGETGTGKEILARALHDKGRREKPMVCVNCGAIPAQLIESTLFGHEKGAFTGASQRQRGVFEEASGGTVFLDEIGELPLAAQAALLRILETGRFSRVGSSREVSVDVRVIAATHRDLEGMCEADRFREDLYHRLNGFTITVPPLRERVDEISPLALHFLQQANTANARSVQGIHPAARSLLERYAWPGNVRELKNAIERAVVITEADELRVEDLPARVRAIDHEDTALVDAARRRRSTAPPASAGKPSAARPVGEGRNDAPADAGAREPAATAPNFSLKGQVQQYEAQLIREVLISTRWNQTEAARRLRIPLRTLVYKLKALGIREQDG